MSNYRLEGYLRDEIEHVSKPINGNLVVCKEKIEGEFTDDRGKKHTLTGLVNRDEGEKVLTILSSNRRAADQDLWIRVRKKGNTAMIGTYQGPYSEIFKPLKNKIEKNLREYEPSSIRGTICFTIYDSDESS